MIRNQTNEELARKDSTDDKAAASSRQWSALKESRIVRVSRVFGGKDRHSKVRTIKGLRDRRVRLSVPTAIQLYDLQERLGLNQPSKVVDWLLNAARHEIDKLPPLQFPPQDLISHLPSSTPISNDEKFGGHNDSAATQTMSIEWNADIILKARERLAMREPCTEKSNTVKDGIGNEDNETHIGRFPTSYRFMGLNNSLGLVNSAMPLAHSSYYPGESWNVHETSSSNVEAHHSPFPSLLSLAPGSQLVFYPSESGFGMKEADHFPIDNLDSQSLSLSSARAFHHSGSQG